MTSFFSQSGLSAPGWLVSCIMTSQYFIYDSRLEERKLVAYHDEIYIHYAKAVPALHPLP